MKRPQKFEAKDLAGAASPSITARRHPKRKQSQIVAFLFVAIFLIFTFKQYHTGRTFVRGQQDIKFTAQSVVRTEAPAEIINPLCHNHATVLSPVQFDLPVVLRRMLESNVKFSGSEWSPMTRAYSSMGEIDRDVMLRLTSDAVVSTREYKNMHPTNNDNDMRKNDTVSIIMHSWYDSNSSNRVVQVEVLGALSERSNGTIDWPSSHWRSQCVLQLRRALYRLRKHTDSNELQWCVHQTILANFNFSTNADLIWVEQLVSREMSSVKKCDDSTHAINVSHAVTFQHKSSCAQTSDGMQAFSGAPLPPLAMPPDSQTNDNATSSSSILIEVALDEQQLRSKERRSFVRNMMSSICSLRNHSVGNWAWEHDANSHAPRAVCGREPVLGEMDEWPSVKQPIELWSAVGQNHFHHSPEKVIATLRIVTPPVGSRPWVFQADFSVAPTPEIIVWSLNMNTIVNYCFHCRSGSPCPKLIGLIPGPFVPHHERIAVEKGVVECALLAGCLPPSMMWLRPAEDEVQHPAQSGPVAYEVASYFQNIPDALENPMQTLKMISEKDIQEFSVEMMLVASTLLPSWVSKTLHPVDLRHSTLEKFVARWSARTLYDPDWFVLPVPSTWALQPTSALLSSLASIQTAEAESMLKMINNLTDSTSTAKKSATSDLTWSIVLPTGPESQTLQTGYDRVEHHVQRLIDINLMKQSTTMRPLSSLEKKKRKRLKVIGSNVSVRARFGWHTENTDAFSDIVVVEQTSLVLLAAENATVVAIDAAQAAVSSTELRWTTFFHYPWVRDNLYHLHNDNILPLLLAVRREEQRERGSSRRSQTADSSYSCRRLVLLPSTRALQTPLPFALDLFRLAFDQVVVLETQPGNRKDKPLRRLYRGLRPASEKCNANVSQTDTESSSMPILLDGPIIFGRPPRPFSTEMRNVAPFALHRIVPMWRETVWEFSTQQVIAATRQSLKVAPASDVMRLYGNMDLLKAIVDDDKKQEIFVTWLIRRRGSRSIDTDGVILGWLADANETLELVHLCHNCVLRIQVCCDGLSFWEQVLLLKRTDILIGVHGAGLLHSIFVDPTPRRIIMASTTHGGKATAATATITPLVVHIGSAHMNHHEQVVIQRLTTLASTNRTYRVRYHTTVTSPFPKKNRAASWRDDFHLSATAIHDMLSHALWLYFSSA